eukprot:TRINITY_DN315_c2_g1_i8.p1 TRINITY_DN315_c2_g1~~TRINITY_DN315_c2_g1_i8.p1  ORF type:complete len:111 (-),score=14.25 TRINITY_DN315_c2_g1_i8:2136-2468(-)
MFDRFLYCKYTTLSLALRFFRLLPREKMGFWVLSSRDYEDMKKRTSLLQGKIFIWVFFGKKNTFPHQKTDFSVNLLCLLFSKSKDEIQRKPYIMILIWVYSRQWHAFVMD